MSYKFNLITDRSEMDSFVIHSDQNSLFQCSPWADVKSNWDHLFTSVYDDEKMVASALVLIRHLPLGKTLFYIPRGPVMDYRNEELVKFFLDHLKETARKRHAIALKFDPCLLSTKYPYTDRKKDHIYHNDNVIAFLEAYGAKHSGFTMHIADSAQPRFNAEMDVTPDYRQHLEHKTQKCIRYSEHKGIEVFEGKEYLDDFSTAMHYTEVRKQVSLRNEEYFKHMMDVYGDHCIVMVAKLNFPKQLKKLQESIASEEEQLQDPNLHKKQKNALNQQLTNDKKELERLQKDYQREGKDEVITSGILAVYNEKLMELFYMGNNPDYLRMYSSYLLYAKCLDRCVDLGITHCSFGGIEGSLDDGLTLFKSNWIMNVEEYIGEFNIIFDPFYYKAAYDVYPLVLKEAGKIKARKSK